MSNITMKRTLILFIILVALLGMTRGDAYASRVEDSRYAIVVGVGHDVNSDNCARLMVSVLKDAGWSMKNIKLLTNRQATHQAVLDAVDWLKTIESEGSTIVVMFACHGASTGVRLWDMMLPHRYIKDYLSALKSQKQLVIIATCQSGGAVIEGFDGITLAEENRIVITSCSEGTVDPCTARYTRWAEAFLLQGIKEGKADANGDGRVSIQEAFKYAGSRMLDNYGQEFYL